MKTNWDEHLTFWRERLLDAPVIELPFDRPRPPVTSYMRSTLSTVVPQTTTTAFDRACEQAGVTRQIGLSTVLQIWLWRHAGHLAAGDVVVGVVTAADASASAANLCALRLRFDRAQSIGDCLVATAHEIAALLPHTGVPFEAVVEALSADDDAGGRAPLFQVALACMDEGSAGAPLRSTRGQLDSVAEHLARCDLTLRIGAGRGGDGLALDAEYDGDLFDKATAERLLGRFVTLLAAFAEAAPDARVGELAIMPTSECHLVLETWNDTSRAYSAECLQDTFARQVAATPDAIALEFGDASLSYREFAARIHRLARELQQLGVTRGSLVGIFAERSLDTMVAIYAVLHLGAAYLPLDPDYPHDRLEFMATDADVRVVLTQSHLRAGMPSALAARALTIDDPALGARLAAHSDAPLDVEHDVDDLAYVIYTSGSTGRPKGVEICHRAIHNRLEWMQEEYGLTVADRVLQKTPLSFDVSVWELFWPLRCGARLVLAAPGGHRDAAYLVREIVARGITTLHFVPSMLQVFLAEPAVSDCTSLRRVFCSGEALSHELQQRCFAKLAATELHNLYGPTEAAVDVTYWACQRRSTRRVVPIGRPVANTTIRIVDAELRPVPIGVPGELCIGGVQLARGYRNRPDLTAERFVADPFTAHTGAGAPPRLYRTGDLARYAADGSIEYLGRIDSQVKLRGFRVELGEIESVLLELPAVREAAVVLRADPASGEQRLIAYLVAAAGQKVPSTSELRRAASHKLPEFMVPSAFVSLDALPLSPSGKLDRRALPDPDGARPELDAVFAKPRDEVEAQITAIWRRALQLDAVGVDDNFFELGGHSLLLIAIRAELQEQFGRDVTMVELFRYPTVASLAAHLSGGADAAAQPAAESTRSARDPHATLDIAVIGMACRLPGAEDVDTFWDNLLRGVEAVRHFTDSELLAAGVDPDLLAHPDYVKSSGVLDDIECFDAKFFGFSPKEAELLDPQQRLFLECAYAVLERAGYDPQRCTVPVGVFAGVGMNGYVLEHLYARTKDSGPVGEFQLMIGNDKDFMPTRVSYKLDLKGPSVNVQTACSTSLVAVHMACRSLLDGECEMAIAGGSSVRVPQLAGYLYQEGMILAPDGRCRAFDAKAQGTVFGSGVGAVVLKRLEHALRDGDHVHAVIKGTAINNDGSLKVGYTAPSVEGQSAAIAKAQAVAGFDPASIGYVEAHGTATALGDPIEVAALTQTFRAKTDRKGYCGLGALKASIGHVDAAAGVAGLIKAVLAVEHGTMPKSLHYEAPNPQIDFANSPFFVVTEPTPWRVTDGPRRAGVSSFGIGGTNAHVVIEAAPQRATTPNVGGNREQLVVLTAKTEAALSTLAQRYATHTERHPDASLAGIAHTTQRGRAHFEHRLAIVAKDTRELGERLRGRLAMGTATTPAPNVVWMFTGQGAQWVSMGRELYDSEPTFRREFDRCAAILRPRLERPLGEVVFGDATTSPLGETAYTQPALFALEWSLACLWRECGVEPSAVLGHSVGEYVAACVAGVFSLEDGLALIAERGRLMQALPRDGGMYAVFATEAQVRSALAGHTADVSIAGINGPRNIVISGRSTALRAVVERLAASGHEHKQLDVSHAFHSPCMEPMLDAFEAFAATIEMRAPRVPLVSNVTGTFADAQIAQASYWRRHVREAVAFEASVRTLVAADHRVFVEIGPQPILTGMARACVDDEFAARAAWLPSMRRGQPQRAQWLEAIGGAFVAGVRIDWAAMWPADAVPTRVPLPTYPFERVRHWVDKVELVAASGTQARATDGRGVHPLIGRRLQLPFCDEIRFESEFRVGSPSYVEDHRVFGVLVVAGASHVGMFLLGANRAFGGNGCEFEELLFLQPFTLSEGGVRSAQLVLTPPSASADDTTVGARELRFASLVEGGDPADPTAWVTHVSGRVQPMPHGAASRARVDVEAIRSRCGERWDGPPFYADFWVQGDDAGPAFRWLETIWRRDGEAIGKTFSPDLPDDLDSYELHPGIIEACFQVLRCCREFESARLFAQNQEIFVPFRIESLKFYGKPSGQPLWCHATIRESTRLDDTSVIGDLWLYDAGGQLVAEFAGFEVRKLPKDVLLRHLQRDLSDWLYRIDWRAVPRGNAPSVAATDGEWLIVDTARDERLGERLLAEFARRGIACTRARTDAHDPQHVQRELAARSGLRGVVHLSGHAPHSAASSVEEIARAHTDVCTNVGHTVTALVSADHSQPVALHFVTCGALPVRPADGTDLDLVHAPLPAMARVVALEHPELGCRRFDLDAVPSDTQLRSLLDELLASDGEDELAYRGEARYVPRLVRLARRRAGRDEAFTVQATGTHVVTGGLGALGLEVARWLVSNGARHIALLGRRPPTADATRAIAELEQSGASVHTFAVDIADARAVETLIARLRDEGRPVCGIVHAAGVVDDGVVTQLTPERFARVLAPKVAGTLHLHRATLREPLDYFVCFSSATALLGAAGQANYAAANGFLDAFAAHRDALGLPILSIDWGPWAEVGMAAALDASIRRRMEQHGWDFIPPAHGLRALGELLGPRREPGLVQVGVLPIHWSRFFEHAHGTPQRLLDELGRGATNNTARATTSKPSRRDELLARVRTLGDRERRAALLEPVREEVASVLGLDLAKVDRRQGFTDMGMDSLMGIELRRRLQDTFGVKLASTFAFDFPNVEDVVGFLADKLAAPTDSAAPTAPTRSIDAADVAALVADSGDLDASIADELARLEASLEDHNEGTQR